MKKNHKLQPKLIAGLIVLALLIGGGFALYQAGVSKGRKLEKTDAAKRRSSVNLPGRSSLFNRNVVGKIIETNGQELTIELSGKQERVVKFDSKTVVRSSSPSASTKDLQPGKRVIITISDKDEDLAARIILQQ